ncbi:MAG: metallophosphoesterase [Albidovulum sp.]
MIAVIADAHFHDLYGDYGLAGNGRAAPPIAMRRLAETARSTRVFNESHAALCYTLEDIGKRGIEHVVLLGDYSDDGQIETLNALRDLLDRYSKRFGFQYYATVGNHDIFGPDGRHRTKRFRNSNGGYDVVTSDPDFTDAKAGRVIVSPTMYCAGYPEGLHALQDVALFGARPDQHWETPFGAGSQSKARLYPALSGDGAECAWLMDASYLVEPFPGLWLMMIDANVFEPQIVNDGDSDRIVFADSTAAGWNAMLRQKPFVLSWMKDVAVRASTQGKHLLAFSHYPVLDPLDGTHEDEIALLGRTELTRRIPNVEVAEAIAATGVKVHFSGHLHVNDTARYAAAAGVVVNISMPSLVAYPAAYKIISIASTKLTVETFGIDDMPLDPGIMDIYRAEVQSGLKAHRLTQCADYGAFLYEHISHLVARRHLRREWPQDLAALIHSLTLADVASLALRPAGIAAHDMLATIDTFRRPDRDAEIARFEMQSNLCCGMLAGIAALTFLEDWYRVKMGSDIAVAAIPSDRMKAYVAIAGLFATGGTGALDGAYHDLSILFRMFDKMIGGLPARNFSVDLVTGDIDENM